MYRYSVTKKKITVKKTIKLKPKEIKKIKKI